ncbi:hypothetical protein ACE1CI_35370 [Aerosakkonemataceae cyanobacterium BLCC-F50]|uniref:Uncharacterized protein n=1 Tax=Floridaenema flaviceps BLCC-F50 TaxID=3153642 RepID=A0ABV4Y2K6_9CYAN
MIGNSIKQEGKLTKMSYDEIPEEPEKRRVIAIVSRLGLQQLTQVSNKPNQEGLAARGIFHNEQVCLIDASTIKSTPLIEKLKGSALFNPGAILIQSPYDPSSYANASEASYTFAKAKCVLFSTLCGLLAARKVSVINAEIVTSNSQEKLSGGANTPYGGGSAEAQKIAEAKMKKEIIIERTFAQNEPKLDKAKEYMSKYQWLSDDHINSLLELREAGVPIEKETYILSVTSESKTNLNIAFSLNIPTQVDLKVNIERIKNETFDFSAKFEVEFW